ncbi:hypothetical protein BK143_03275 [Paenibacillus peoriae]|uniref:DUF917 domain-containing protein n=1 Tax=Paenibacillus TaxID=44249 RepID=UPI00096EB57A|nr:DUF917 family protein [Paenibacillus peoriae]OMF75405.1 hypothetical protein BK143_03275 [Paenibacillus peoriae]
MDALKLDERIVEYAVYGGAVLGGGGGGWVEEGLRIGKLALEAGQPLLVPIDSFADDDLFVTVAVVGAPAAPDKYVKPVHYVKALEMVSSMTGKVVRALHTNENGGETTINGWFQSALTGLPVVDFACNGRAHPTGTMGSMNLTELPNYVSHQAAVGGSGEHYMEVGITGSLDHVASLVRKTSVEAGGLVAVARNPVTAAYAKANGAPGAISRAIAVGEAMLAHQGEAAIAAVTAELGGKVIAAGEVTECRLETSGGFDAGVVRIADSGRTYEMTFWNEYMSLELDGERLATFPDLIMTLDMDTGRPVITAAVVQGQRLAIIAVRKEQLLLSTTMFNRKLLQPIEEIIHKPILSYL